MYFQCGTCGQLCGSTGKTDLHGKIIMYEPCMHGRLRDDYIMYEFSDIVRNTTPDVREHQLIWKYMYLRNKALEQGKKVWLIVKPSDICLTVEETKLPTQTIISRMCVEGGLIDKVTLEYDSDKEIVIYNK